MGRPYACKVIPENIGVIASEAGLKFDRQFAEDWLKENVEGYFLRDESSVLDCSLLESEVFLSIYAFEDPDIGELFRRVVKL